GERDPGPVEVGERGVDGAVVGRPVEQVLQRQVDEGAPGGPDRRRLWEPVDVGELERERALLERADRARRQGVGERGHRRRRVSPGYDAPADRSPPPAGSVARYAPPS